MRGSLKLGTIARIPIRIHWTFGFLLLLVVGGSGGSAVQILDGLAWIGALFACVTIHELSHCAVAKKRGLPVKDIILLPLGGVSEIEGLTSADPVTERDVAIVGPLTNVCLAALFGLIALVTGAHIWPPTLFAGSWFSRLAWLNVVLAVFNMVPALPMDGGRVFRAVLARRGDPLKATRIASAVAIGFGAAMVVAGVAMPDWILSIIGLFVIMGAVAERRSAIVKATVGGIQVGTVMSPDPTTVLSEVTAGQLAPWLASFPGRAVPIVDSGSYVGLVAIEDLATASPWARVGELADRKSPVLDASQSLYPDAFTAFASTRRLQLAVTSGGRVVGVLYRWTLQTVLRQQQSAGGVRSGGTRAA